jgi:hypothetical protein
MTTPPNGAQREREETSVPVLSWAWAMPNKDTFTIAPIRDRVELALANSKCSVDPFARNKRWATWTNDIDPSTTAEHHMEARAFLGMLIDRGVKADLVLLDPPYSPTQITRAYASAGLSTSRDDTQNARLWRECRELLTRIALPGAVAITCGWNSTGMCHPWIKNEVLIVNHGGAHNDTICVTSSKPTS